MTPAASQERLHKAGGGTLAIYITTSQFRVASPLLYTVTMAFMIPAVRNEYDIYLSRSPRSSGSPPPFSVTASSVEDYLRNLRASPAVCQNNNTISQNNNVNSSPNSKDLRSGPVPRRKTSRDMSHPQGKLNNSELMEKLKRCNESHPS